MESLTAEEIIEINKKVGEKGTVINRGNLEFIIQKANKIEKLGKRAAIILHDIITSHVFLDGNKRTAFVSAVTVIELNGKKVEIADEAVLDLVYGIANGKYNISEVENIIERCIK